MIVGIASADRVPPSSDTNGIARWGGSGWIRIGQYLDHLSIDKIVVGFLTWKYQEFTITDDAGTEHIPDVIIIQRLMHSGLSRHISMARANGQKIINDVDDWYWGLSTKNAAWYVSHPKVNPNENSQHYRSVISSSDLVTVSTPYLLDRLSSFTKAPLFLLENTVDISRFNRKQHTDCPPVLGWAGSTAHRSGDLETIASILRKVYNEGDYSLLHVGDAPQHPSFASVIGLEQTKVSTVPLQPADVYPTTLVMDVGIVPLSKIPFNRAKSDIKGLEYAAAGVPFIAQNLDSYVSLKERYGIGRVVKQPVDWLRNLRALKDYRLREEESLSNYELVAKRDVHIGARQWEDLLLSI